MLFGNGSERTDVFNIGLSLYQFLAMSLLLGGLLGKLGFCNFIIWGKKSFTFCIWLKATPKYGPLSEESVLYTMIHLCLFTYSSSLVGR